ncbi:uncharacterized protein (UPF0548 family) [Arthrobacter pigmenti]|uniref:Uncharacterized protein (UPF0548 family) n=1 Tax=Arthrobacter pigmenti TaxID=271432 RepID=A0A846RPV3_9MICC|nr:DUF1990 domain-containing protein [Arthrobacter pigmenti]NJC21136.1 uncharacterized protein (UPF0548 family) [Arthrobacter pigmenti]
MIASTAPELPAWPPSDSAYRRSEATAVVGHGDQAWQRAAEDVLLWRVKTRSGFTVGSDVSIHPGQRLIVTARVLGFSIREPIEVVSVVRESDRSGFSYRTLPGHPVCGEEAFIVHRRGDEVLLTVRSLTRAAAQQPWRTLFPALLVAQRIVRRRYLRALRR